MIHRPPRPVKPRVPGPDFAFTIRTSVRMVNRAAILELAASGCQGRRHADCAIRRVGIVTWQHRAEKGRTFTMRAADHEQEAAQKPARDSYRVQSVDRAMLLLRAISASA